MRMKSYPIVLTRPVSVDGFECETVDVTELETPRGHKCTHVWLDWNPALAASSEALQRDAIGYEGENLVVRDEGSARRLGRLFYSQLHPDIGHTAPGQYASLARSELYFRRYFPWLAKLTGKRDLWPACEEQGRTRYPILPSFTEWKKSLHFPTDGLPSEVELNRANAFLDEFGPELALTLARERMKPRWGKNTPPPQYWNAPRSLSRRRGRAAGLSEGEMSAATLLSYADAGRHRNRLAESILSAIPDGVLQPTDASLFRHFWLCQEGVDERGRYDLPIGASPLLSSMVLYLCEIDDEGVAGDSRGILCDLVHFLATGERTRGVDIVLGLGSYLPLWLVEERQRDRERKRRKRFRHEMWS